MAKAGLILLLHPTTRGLGAVFIQHHPVSQDGQMTLTKTQLFVILLCLVSPELVMFLLVRVAEITYAV